MSQTLSINPNELLVGIWKLSSFEFKESNGNVTYPFGKEAKGILIYSEQGYMSVHVMRPDRPPFISGDQSKGTLEEIRTAFEGCISYYGRYEVDEDNKIVTHHVEGSLFPNWTGQSLQRYFEFQGKNTLILRTTPLQIFTPGAVGVLVWNKTNE